MLDLSLGQAVRELALLAVPFLSAITVHEYAHGLAADRLGDPTPRLAGRLTLNPLKHLDALGTLALVLTRMIGWAKPVPVNPRHFADPRGGMLLVSVAGPAANLLLALALAAVYQLLGSSLGAPVLRLVPPAVLEPALAMLYLGVQLNLVLGFFNLLPVPPMDGSGIVAWLLPHAAARRYLDFGRYGMVVILLLAASGALGAILGPPVRLGLNILLS